MILEHGSHERVKGAVHGVLGLLAAVCAIYNVSAFIFRKEKHLAINTVAYVALTAWELKKVRCHRGKSASQ